MTRRYCIVPWHALARCNRVKGDSKCMTSSPSKNVSASRVEGSIHKPDQALHRESEGVRRVL